MSKAVTIIGVIILLIGLVGIGGWIYAYNQVSGIMELLPTGEQMSESMSGLDSLLPSLGGMVSVFGSFLSQIKVALAGFFSFNIVINVAMVLNGIALVILGKKE